MAIRPSLGFVLLILLSTSHGCRAPKATALSKLREAARTLPADRSSESPGEPQGEPQGEIESLWLEGVVLLHEAPPDPGPEREEVLNALLLAVTRHPAPAVRCSALRGLALLAGPDGPDGPDGPPEQVREGLTFGLADPSATVRALAAELALLALGPQVLPDYAVLLSRRQSDRELLSALKALGPYAFRLRDEPQLLRAVYDCVEHQDPGVSFHARGVLARMIGLPGEDPAPAEWWRQWWTREGLR